MSSKTRATTGRMAGRIEGKRTILWLYNIDSLGTKTGKWIDFRPVFFCLYFSFSYCVVTFLVDNALARVELCHTLATKLDSLQEMKLSENDVGSDKDETGEAKKKSIFYI